MSKTIKKIVSLTLVVIMVLTACLAATSCGNNNTTTTGPDGNTGTPAEYTYKSYTTALGTNWNPHAWETNADQSILSYISSPFVDMSILDSENGVYQWVYEMATSITDVTADNQSDLTKYGSSLPADAESASDVTEGYVFEIRLNPNAKWENGEAITSEDYIESMKRLLDSKMRNYRANLYISGESALAGALAFYNSEALIYENWLESNGYFPEAVKNSDGKMTINVDGVDQVISFSFTQGIPFFGGYSMYDYYDAGYVSYFYTPYTGDTSDPENLPAYVVSKEIPVDADEDGENDVDENGDPVVEVVYYADLYQKWVEEENGYRVISATEELYNDIKTIALNFGDPNPEAWNEFGLIVTGYGEKVEWDKVGLYAVDDYTIRYVTQTYIGINYFLTSCTDTWLVYVPLYDELKDTSGELVTTKYGTSKDTSMSYGVYKISSLEDDKQIVFVQNETWYGWETDENGNLISYTNFLVDGEKRQQYQTTKIVIDVMDDDTAKLVFLKGELSDWAPSAEELSTYNFSDQLYKVDETYTMSFFFNTDVSALQTMDTSKGNKNSVVLSNEAFRKAFSLAIDRAEYVTATQAYKPAFSLMNSLYFYDIYDDDKEDGIDGPNTNYRATEAAMQAIVNLYGVKYGEGEIYKTLKEAHDSITGYNLSEAKNLMKQACEELVEAGLYTAGEEITVKIGWAKGALTSDDNKQLALMNKYINAAIEGSGFGKITLEAVGNISNRYAAVPNGDYAIGYGAWGGAAFYPFRNFQVYMDPDQYDINEAACYDPTTETLTLVVDGVEDTMTWQEWSNCLIGTGKYAQASTATKLSITAQLEEAFLKTYYRIPLCATTICSMLSFQCSYYTEDYNIMYGFGGMRLMKYNYTDAQWADFVKTQVDANGQLDYQ